MRFFFIVAVLFSINLSGQSIAHKEQLILMGTAFELIAVGKNSIELQQCVQAGIKEIRRIESLISSWDPKSQTSEINRNAGRVPTQVDKELFSLIQRSLKISNLTQGAFDISFASLGDLYSFDGKEHELPDRMTIAPLLPTINYKGILVNPEQLTVQLEKVGMKIGFGAIGKGYAANMALDVMKKFAVSGIVVNASGDIRSWGKNEKGKDWYVGITDPNDLDETLGTLYLKEDMSVVTSGNYLKYFTSNEKRYSHIINPKTGIPTTGIKSVTILCPDAELADALATSIFVLGEKDGLLLINSLKSVEGLIVTDNNSILTSLGLDLQYTSQ